MSLPIQIKTHYPAIMEMLPQHVRFKFVLDFIYDIRKHASQIFEI